MVTYLKEGRVGDGRVNGGAGRNVMSPTWESDLMVPNSARFLALFSRNLSQEEKERRRTGQETARQ